MGSNPRGLLVLAAALAAAGVARSDATPAAAWLNEPLSVRQMGLGGVSLGDGDVLRAWSNPALLAGQETRGEVSLNGGSLRGAAESAVGVGAGWRLTSGWAVGALFSSYSTNLQEVDAFGNPAGGSIGRNALAGGLTTAFRADWFSAGVTLKGVSDGLAGNVATTGAADAGVSAGFAGLLAGVAVRNVGGVLRAPSVGVAGGDALSREIRAGGSWRLESLHALVAAEYLVGANQDSRAGVGAEWWPAKSFGIRAGLAGLGPQQGSQLTAGLSALLGGVGLDYAFATHPLGMTHSVSLRYTFGEAPVAAAVEASAPGLETAPVAASMPVAAAPVLQAAVAPTLAVAQLDPLNVSAGDAAVISDMLRSHLIQDGQFQVIEKSNMDKVLSEQSFQQTGCTTAECAVKLGKILNVKYLIVGSFGKLLGQYVLSYRLVDVESAKAIFSDVVRGLNDQNDVANAITSMVKKLGKAMRSVKR